MERTRAVIGLVAVTLAADGLARTVARAEEPAAAPAPVEVARTHGLRIPAARPRLWFDAPALERAKAWYRRNPFQPRGYDDRLALSQATHGLLASSEVSCRAALAWATAHNETLGANAAATGSRYMDGARWHGETIILAYDWCHRYLTEAERDRFIERANAWIEARRTTPWGGVPMHQNNYYWAFLRNELEWGIASYGENAAAERFIADAVDARYTADFLPGARTEGRGGVAQEGSQYGPYLTGYALVPFVTAGALGRDLYAESSFWKEAVYANIYATTPGPTVTELPGPGTQLGYAYFPHSDIQEARWTARALDGDAGFMSVAAMRWGGAAVGQHARRWLETTGSVAAPHVQAVDPGGASRPFTALPLDYFAPGVKYLYGRTAWTPAATAIFLQLGDRNVTHVGGHQHIDWGSWQIWRNGRFVSRETAGYSEKIAGYRGGAPVDAFLEPAHNVLLVEGAGISTSPYPHEGDAVVTRLESRPGYLFAAVDLTKTRGSRPRFANPHFVSWVREFVFVRGLETLVVLDRIRSDHPDDVKTFLAHCEVAPSTSPRGATCAVGGQALELRTLVPAAATYRVVVEGGRRGQQRIEVDTAPGATESYVLTTLQARDAAGASLTPSVVDGRRTFTVTLDGATSVTFQKGMSSSRGAITLGGVTTPLAAGVQEIVVTDDGPAWR